MGAVKEVADVANSVANIYSVIDNSISRRREAKQQQKQFDQNFAEDQRRFGLNYALQNFATREGISLQKANQLYTNENLGMAKQAQAENLKTSALGRNIQSTQFAWQKQDRDKMQNINKAVQKGLVMGAFGGK